MCIFWKYFAFYVKHNSIQVEVDMALWSKFPILSCFIHIETKYRLVRSDGYDHLLPHNIYFLFFLFCKI
jgi:hypothetical protein